MNKPIQTFEINNNQLTIDIDEFIHNMKVLVSKHHNEWNDTIKKFETKFHQEREMKNTKF